MNKKKLLYVYIEEFRGFHKREFNFSTDRRFHFEAEDNIFLLKQDECAENLPDGFWGSNISEVNLLIGNNGSGKTRLIKTVCQWMCQLSEGKYPQEKGILIFQDEDNLRYVAFYQEKEWNISVPIPKMRRLSDNRCAEYCRELKLVYFSNTMTGLEWDKYDILLNFSMPHRIDEANKRGYAMGDHIFEKYRQHEFDRQYNFFGQYMDLKINDTEKNVCKMNNTEKRDYEVFPKYIQMEIHHQGFEKISSLLPEQYKYIKEDLSQLWEIYFPQYIANSNLNEIRLCVELLRSLLMGVICKLFKWEQRNVADVNKRIVISILRGFLKSEQVTGTSNISNLETGIEWIRQLLKDLLLDCETCYLDSTYKKQFELSWSKKFINSVDNFMDMMLPKLSPDKISFLSICELVHESLEQTKDIWQISMEVLEMKTFQEFWNVYREIAFCMENVFFYWNASSGQQNWMNLFSILCDNSLNDKSIWFFLDEPDNTFHPEWERNLLSWIVKCCERDECSKDIQIFISTHSPIVLSDMPGMSVTYLSEKFVEESRIIYPDTFGQNIYFLFSEALCLQKGVMGVFASNKIMDVLKELQTIEKDLFCQKNVNKLHYRIKFCEQVINIVAEPLFKRQMQEYLIKCKELAEGK